MKAQIDTLNAVMACQLKCGMCVMSQSMKNEHIDVIFGKIVNVYPKTGCCEIALCGKKVDNLFFIDNKVFGRVSPDWTSVQTNAYNVPLSSCAIIQPGDVVNIELLLDRVTGIMTVDEVAAEAAQEAKAMKEKEAKAMRARATAAIQE